MKHCENCRYYRPGQKLAIGQDEPATCMLAPPTPFMVQTRNALGDVIPAIISGRPTVAPDDYCASFEAAGSTVKLS